MDFFWQLFEKSGSINAYLWYKECENNVHDQQKEKPFYVAVGK